MCQLRVFGVFSVTETSSTNNYRQADITIKCALWCKVKLRHSKSDWITYKAATTVTERLGAGQPPFRVSLQSSLCVIANPCSETPTLTLVTLTSLSANKPAAFTANSFLNRLQKFGFEISYRNLGGVFDVHIIISL